MSNNTNDQFLQESSHTIQVPEPQRRLLVQKYLQNPFSVAWSKLAALFQADQSLDRPEPSETEQFEQPEPDVNQKQDLSPRFTDPVDPSLYYTIFFPPYWF